MEESTPIAPRLDADEQSDPPISPIEQLEDSEKKLVQMLELASLITEELSRTHADQQKLEQLTLKYLTLLKEVKETMLQQIPHLQGGAEFKADAYGVRKDLELSSKVVDMVRAQVDQMSLQSL
mmetsp:Transcript_43972/g.110837  ORF Transcript_43972/g.110837 Transcript_43972/m.110837 type:complete len:123 (+) Transcript_43972:99-467(+)|eukprot:CAMPEP_0174233716 /NCGR_PEP_ID=MMETSP0417-20130205/3686_1 /TAXON_ID=242541 /ORGANISM="Mayorella sp, Strain BSH-02190019" /LENGTH=122 /DNA_ID=CAMNT_0015311975 /DNA_START=58 /DNA_END=426 /DNA_ORIENTATION=-